MKYTNSAVEIIEEISKRVENPNRLDDDNRCIIKGDWIVFAEGNGYKDNIVIRNTKRGKYQRIDAGDLTPDKAARIAELIN